MPGLLMLVGMLVVPPRMPGLLMLVGKLVMPLQRLKRSRWP
jgi:hypothetical protein